MEEKETVLLEFIHELMTLMPILNRSASFISMGSQGKPDIPSLINKANNILEITEIINTHLTLLNVALNPEFYSIQKKQPINIHGSFSRCSKFLKAKAREKDIQIYTSVNGKDNIPQIESLNIITAIPFIILDNSIKYCIKSSSIDIEFTRHPGILEILVSSEGPKVNDTELLKLTEKGYRGENAKQINPNGKGLGLFYLKTICDLCNINVSIASSKNSYLYQNIEYSTFSISLQINLHIK